jgi:hypothetical protein
MTKQFQYTSRKEMEPRPGVRFATTYYKQTQREYTLLRQHIYSVAAEIMALCDSDLATYRWWTTPLKGYKKTTGANYTPCEIVTDMVEQFVKQKDLPSGMLGRWQRLFSATPWNIELVSGVPARTTQFGELFTAGNNYGL